LAKARLPWPDSAAPAVSNICPDFIVEWAMAKMWRDENLPDVLLCGCYEDACHCGEYPTEQEDAWCEGHLPTKPADLDLTDLLRNRFDGPSDL
jgi:hypothetical protein